MVHEEVEESKETSFLDFILYKSSLQAISLETVEISDVFFFGSVHKNVSFISFFFAVQIF